MIASTTPGTPATLEILRNGQPQTVNVTLDQRPSNLSYTGGPRRSLSEGALRGVTVQNLTATLRKQLGVPAETHGVVVTGSRPRQPCGAIPSAGRCDPEHQPPRRELGGRLQQAGSRGQRPNAASHHARWTSGVYGDPRPVRREVEGEIQIRPQQQMVQKE